MLTQITKESADRVSHQKRSSRLRSRSRGVGTVGLSGSARPLT
jgi:hypothetical protein